jgi:hypothetical protein
MKISNRGTICCILTLSLASNLVVCIQFQEREREPRDGAFLASTFLERNYAQDCTFKFIHNKSAGGSKEWTRGTLKYLTKGMSSHAFAFFDINENQTFTDSRLDLFLAWEKGCVVNVLYLLNTATHDQEAALDFTMKLSNRDRTSFYFVAYEDEAGQKFWLYQRLRNFKSACFLAMENMTVDCLEDHKLDGSVQLHQVGDNTLLVYNPSFLIFGVLSASIYSIMNSFWQ